VTEEPKRPTLTLKSGAVVDALEGVAVAQDLQVFTARHPDQLRTLLALAEGRVGDANPEHFRALRIEYYLEKDERTVRPVVREVLLNCYQETPEGPVIAPLRLASAADLPGATHAEAELERRLRDLLSGDLGDDQSKG
jgi:hypothetical protein